jgi:molecular chaperone DnaK (HSP70)
MVINLQAVADFFGKDPSRTLNAKECVSRGAALQCAMLSPIFRCAGVPTGLNGHANVDLAAHCLLADVAAVTEVR